MPAVVAVPLHVRLVRAGGRPVAGGAPFPREPIRDRMGRDRRPRPAAYRGRAAADMLARPRRSDVRTPAGWGNFTQRVGSAAGQRRAPKLESCGMIRSSNLAVPFQVTFTNGVSTSTADVPKEKGGAGRGFGPHELLEAALATCLTITVHQYAARHQFPLTSASAEVHIDRSDADEVTLVYTLRLGGPLSNEQRRRLAAAAAKCPVRRTLCGRLTCRDSNAPIIR
jgi:putative redox protein